MVIEEHNLTLSTHIRMRMHILGPRFHESINIEPRNLEPVVILDITRVIETSIGVDGDFIGHGS